MGYTWYNMRRYPHTSTGLTLARERAHRRLGKAQFYGAKWLHHARNSLAMKKARQTHYQNYGQYQRHIPLTMQGRINQSNRTYRNYGSRIPRLKRR